MLELDHGRPGAGVDLKRHLVDALSGPSQSPLRLRAGFAYVTRTGIKEVFDDLAALPRWRDTKKRWLVGIHHAISEPVAISALVNLPNSEVRLALCNLSMQSAILGRQMFHAKVLGIDVGKKHVLSTLIAGSANLTGAAIGPRARNFEIGFACKADVDAKVAAQFGHWWDDAWEEGVSATSLIIDEYVRNRDLFLRANPDVLVETSMPSASAVSAANMLWIEAGSMSGGSRNQVEFSADLAAFFGPVVEQRRLLTIVVGSNSWSDRPLTPKRTTFDVGIWRLSLPTAARSGFEYPGRTICFSKEETASGTEYRLDVADDESAKDL
jgi:HKD family nuclease